MAATAEELVTVREIGPEIAETVAHFFHEPHNRELIEALKAAGVQMRGERNAPPTGPWRGRPW